MKTYLECIPCFFSQAIEASRLLGLNQVQTKEILDGLARLLPGFNLTSPPPETSRHLYALIAEKSGQPDPYAALKRTSNAAALAVYPQVKRKVMQAAHPLRAAVEVACAGNIIDYGALGTINLSEEISIIMERIEDAAAGNDKTLFAFDDFKRSLRHTRQLLYLLDNAGEIVFDRILIEQIQVEYPELAITTVVRGAPAINDCLEEDARAAGLSNGTKVISNGSNAPGTILQLCSDYFHNVWERSDMVISKGQGNYESLSDQQKNVFFLLTVKCPVVARGIGAKVRSTVLLHVNFRRP